MSRDCPLIAVVDDEDAVRTALRRLLASAGMKVVTFCGGREFLQNLARECPDCAVIDLHMPEMTGFDVLERLAEMKTGVPVIIITGHDSSDAEAAATRGGAFAYLRKPITDLVLLAAIAAAIASTSPPL
jgi:FixJ family two-component response regulator